MGWYTGSGWGAGGSGWGLWEVTSMWVVMIAFWALVAWAVYSLAFGSHRDRAHEPRDDETRRILDQRLAKGEIDTDTYRHLREVLESHEHREPIGSR